MVCLKVCMITKFPPIEGGVSATAYWLAKGLAETGVEVHVVTNSLSVEEEYTIPSCDLEGNLPEGVTVHQTATDTPWHIPFSPLYETKLLDKALEVCAAHQIDLLDGFYLIPYGITAFLAAKLTGLPYVIRHGGSDLAKFWQQGVLPTLLRLTLSQANALLTDRPELRYLNENCYAIPRYVPDERFFHPNQKPDRDTLTLAYVGKINYYWQHKGLDRILEFWRPYSGSSRLLFLGSGLGKDDFIARCSPAGVEFLNFVPPWQMPAFLRGVDYLFYLVKNNPVPDFSNLVLEAVASGVRILTDDLGAFSAYETYFPVSGYVLAMENFSVPQTVPVRPVGGLQTTYAAYITANLNLYRRVAGRGR
ncbi:MAG: glycosyltransferase [Clostridia bacterium]|nr:glycosyltransferase [Clostridia bacterium]